MIVGVNACGLTNVTDHGYRTLLFAYINPDHNTEWSKAISVPCGCIHDFDHDETNHYWIEILRQEAPEPFVRCERVPEPEENEEEIDWHAYYQDEKNERSRRTDE